VSRSASVSECECRGVRVSRSASVSECECLEVRVSRSASVLECECLEVRVPRIVRQSWLAGGEECLGVRVPRIVRQSWLAGGEAVGAAGEGRVEGENSLTFSCRLALARLRGLERRLCAPMQCPWQRPQPGAPAFPAASQNSSLSLLRLLKMVEDGPHGRTRMSGRVSFDDATWHGDTVPRMHRQAVPAPWAAPGAVPSFFASWACCYTQVEGFVDVVVVSLLIQLNPRAQRWSTKMWGKLANLH